MNSQETLVLGLDIGGTAIKSAAVRAPDDIIETSAIPSQAKEGGPEAVRKAVGQAIRHYQAKDYRFAAIGIGCAGSIDHHIGAVRNSPNFADWKNVPLRDWIQQDFGVPVWIENDANCAVLAEWRFGKGKGFSHVVLLTLGTGIGGGIILENRLHRGATGTAGEIGHLSIHADGVECSCGNRGCFERYCSARAIEAKAPGLSAKQVFDNVEDPQLSKLVDIFVDELGIGLTGLANVLDPDLVLLGGALSRGLPPYMERLKKTVQERAFPAVGKHVKIEFTEHENWSGALGAATLALENSNERDHR